jgi:hypothetical protein
VSNEPRNPSATYLNAQFDQLAAAADHSDGDGAVHIIETIRSDGYPELADKIMGDVIRRGLQNMAIDSTTPRTDEMEA